MKASILTIGDEILIGQIVDTNSASIARHLNNAGIVVWERTSVGDQREQITEAVKRTMNQSDVVILTGGLGPTKDDITKKTLAELFGSRLVCDQTVADHVRAHARSTRNRIQPPEPRSGARPGVLHRAFQRPRHGPRHVVRTERQGRGFAAGRPLRNGAPDDRRGNASSESPFLPAADRTPHADHGRSGRIDAGRKDRRLGKCPAPVPPPGISARTRRGAAAPVGLRSRRRERIARNRPGNSPPCNASFPATSSDSSGRPCRRSSTTC